MIPACVADAGLPPPSLSTCCFTLDSSIRTTRSDFCVNDTRGDTVLENDTKFTWFLHDPASFHPHRAAARAVTGTAVESTGNPRHGPCSTRPSERFPVFQRDGTANGTAVTGTRLGVGSVIGAQALPFKAEIACAITEESPERSSRLYGWSKSLMVKTKIEVRTTINLRNLIRQLPRVPAVCREYLQFAIPIGRKWPNLKDSGF
ncbi:hypothetical protein C8R45DRAFT_926091 [Mycena sanguinolenta]|nr:hypothetical protein C8R45DRAFT_926091 [Mycena sanguinolenta]